MDTSNLEKAHHEHLADQTEHSGWLGDIANWREENRQTLALLATLRSRIIEHEEDLVSHEQVILAHEQQVLRHERELADRARSGEGSESPHNAAEHEQFVAKHANERERHAALGHNQRQVQVVAERLKQVLHTCH